VTVNLPCTVYTEHPHCMVYTLTQGTNTTWRGMKMARKCWWHLNN